MTSDLKPLTVIQTGRRMREMRMALINQIANHLAQYDLTQAEMATMLGITRPRLNRLLHKDAALFAIDALLTIAVRAGMTVHLQVARRYRHTG